MSLLSKSGYMLATRLILLFCLIGLLVSCSSPKSFSRQKPINIPYTYWWTDDGPFIGLCGRNYAFAARGKLLHIGKLDSLSNAYFTAQQGSIHIQEVMVSGGNIQTGSVIRSDCFAGSALKKGDEVLIFCYEYEGKLCIPGGQSLLRISGKKDPALASIRRYIQAGFDPIAIEADTTLWASYKLDTALKQIIDCAKNQ